MVTEQRVEIDERIVAELGVRLGRITPGECAEKCVDEENTGLLL